MIEHRFGRREAIGTLVKVTLFNKGEYVASGRLGNISLHGLFVETEQVFVKNQFLEVRVSVPDAKRDRHHRLFAMVIHNSGTGVGLFVDVLNPEALAGLRALEKKKDNKNGGFRPDQRLQAVGY